ncbi:type VII secretion target [Mycobacteroides abscessus]|uniref:type VII secretion target n=1 Tax=Mycobacteroides abscessus TaxID=36809 RepID=UPI0003869B85|nr:type VII secretion target [Mycobacteroides abscessus]EPZ18768.1 hypothetical protein M879_19370 [Mycobacteroides abscessus V06705]MDO3268016.1 type VII secretion target [Mycobacteroides abscessus subsp. abscessus]SLF48485.1 Protein of uncharacterised function (DUF2580) [Mycobacteroides abscessus subsp. abscessus]
MSVERTEVDPAKMQEWANKWDKSVQAAQAARAEHAEKQQQVESWGPLSYAARRSAADAIAARDEALVAQMKRDGAFSDALRQGAHRFEEMNDQNAATLRQVAE